MDNNLDKIATDLYGKIQTRFPNIKIGDENAQVLSKKSDIPKARFFEFQYKEHGNPLGTIAITLDDDDGVVIQVSGELANNTSSLYHNAYKFIRSFRKFAKNRLLNFDVQNIGKSNLDKRDYMFQAKPKVIPVELPKETQIMESKMFGTGRISYQDIGDSRVIVKHNQSINPDIAGARSMHIESIFVENSDGERFKYPYKHLNGARALAEHVNHGGTPYDSIGKHITGLSEELSQLRKFKNYVGRQTQISEAMGSVTDKVLERIANIKKEVQGLQRSSYYESFVESFEEKREQIIPEDVMNDWVDRLTIKTFNEELTEVFPYLYNIVETQLLPIRELNADDLLAEAFGQKGLAQRLKNKHGIDLSAQEQEWITRSTETAKRHKEAEEDEAARAAEWKEKFGKKSSSLTPELKFETFIEQLVTEDKDTLFSLIPGTKNHAINDFNMLLSSEMVGGVAGILALKGLIDDPELTSKIEVLKTDKEVRDEIKQYILDKEPKLLKMLPKLDAKEPEKIGGEQPNSEQMPLPEPDTSPEMTPPAASPDNNQPPLAEGCGKKTKMKATFIKAKAAGAKLDTPFAEGMTILDAIKECGLNPSECGYVDEPQNGITELLKIISGFWNKEDKNFTIGGTRAKIKVVKAFEDGDCPSATKQDVKRVLLLIDKKDPSGNSDNAADAITGQHDSREDALASNIKFMQEQPITENELYQIKKNAGLD